MFPCRVYFSHWNHDFSLCLSPLNPAPASSQTLTTIWKISTHRGRLIGHLTCSQRKLQSCDQKAPYIRQKLSEGIQGILGLKSLMHNLVYHMIRFIGPWSRPREDFLSHVFPLHQCMSMKGNCTPPLLPA